MGVLAHVEVPPGHDSFAMVLEKVRQLRRAVDPGAVVRDVALKKLALEFLLVSIRAAWLSSANQTSGMPPEDVVHVHVKSPPGA